LELLTKEALELIEPDRIFNSGILIDLPGEINLARTGNRVRWVAVRGDALDWCIYAQNPHEGNLAWDFDEVRRVGDKIHSEDYIRKLVSCTDECFKLYRY